MNNQLRRFWKSKRKNVKREEEKKSKADNAPGRDSTRECLPVAQTRPSRARLAMTAER